MDISDAIRIVLDLAQGSIADKDEEPEANAEHCAAIDAVENYVESVFT